MTDWINVPRVMKYSTISYNSSNTSKILLGETFSYIDDVPGLKTTLYPHQKTAIKAMLDLEMNRCHKISIQSNVLSMKTSAGVLSEAVGSGKTIDVLSLILLQKIPDIHNDISNISLCEHNSRVSPTICLASTIRKKFRNVLTPTIIFVGVSVINQWVDAIKTFTDLTVFAVYNVRDLQILINMMTTKVINDYDIVVVKNGKVTRHVALPDFIILEEKNKSQVSHIYNIISNMRNYCWARVVIDDFDTIKMPVNCGMVNGLFTWYISATKKTMHYSKTRNKQFKTTSDMLLYNEYRCPEVMNNHVLFSAFNIQNNSDFIKKTNCISSPKIYLYVFNNTNDQYIKYLGLFNNADAREVMEMLNGDAIETAAEKVGIVTTKVADIFQIMLGEQYNKFTRSREILGFIQKNDIYGKDNNRLPFSENPDQTDTYNKTHLLKMREILYNYPNIKNLLETTKKEYKTIYDKSSVAINRVKNNIKEGECPICTTELDDDEEEILILKCCGVILCGSCCFGSVFKKDKLDGICCNCRNIIKINSLIYLNKDFRLSNITDDRLEVKTRDVNKNVNKIQNTKTKNREKLDAIIDIINGDVPIERKTIDINIPSMMKGTHRLPYANKGNIKVLIFANYEETLKKIKNHLDSNNVNYWILHGSHSEIQKTAALFQNHKTNCVLLINSIKHCSGLNLQTSTDLIFSHRIMDKNIESQVIGRGQRLGRTNTLRIHYICYENEYRYMRNTHIRMV